MFIRNHPGHGQGGDRQPKQPQHNQLIQMGIQLTGVHQNPDGDQAGHAHGIADLIDGLHQNTQHHPVENTVQAVQRDQYINQLANIAAIT